MPEPPDWFETMTGRWRVVMSTWAEDGTATHADHLEAETVLIADGRYLREDLSGAFGDGRHEKLSLFGWNATRARHEYVSADDHDGVLLLYATLPGRPGDGGGVELFADYAAPDEGGGGGPATFVTIRTVLEVQSSDRRTLRNFYRPAGRPERPFLEYLYVRTS